MSDDGEEEEEMATSGDASKEGRDARRRGLFTKDEFAKRNQRGGDMIGAAMRTAKKVDKEVRRKGRGHCVWTKELRLVRILEPEAAAPLGDFE
ncbi:hypothetical protein HPB50_022574 [Hyalomma asiaticum]|uniref:Uncharacterized protein n=1 Tax=Hyalomma asiaticum TaxID=266040 RepID=A0ACB7RW50_HYAAI|nr:hypothetical protein HPB50_022574 [Hyalomma asiaticum]